ncbi:hypothetical protein RM553_17045 [Zunongwangia sp. F363]|uniref:Uncharacterized protein n=1 Tax=Autumnicola tepida TaxID=3075595 RepID=A0ABU3CDY1_9FLAO|nr:hypothetical protein [Zunongwangia sp. F363]MDT0644550.1 hypothetical protein [Zunongwangia sp. F363]
MSFDLFPYLASIAFIYTYGQLALHFAPKIFYYFLNEPFAWQKQVEKPRIFLHLIGLSYMYLMVYSYSSLGNRGIFIQLITWLAFILGFFSCYFTWTEKFQVSFQSQLKKNATRSSENFNLSISDSQLGGLYNEMIRHELIDQDRTTVEDFKNVLLKDWKSHDSKLHFKMDGPSCREFYDHLTKKFPNNTLTLKNLFINSGLIFRPDGKKYNYNTLKNAPTRTHVSKQHEVIINIFQKLN